MIKLHKAMGFPGQEAVHINPSLVLYVEGTSVHTILHFEGGLSLAVVEPLSKVVKEIEKAIC